MHFMLLNAFLEKKYFLKKKSGGESIKKKSKKFQKQFKIRYFPQLSTLPAQ